MKQLKVISEFRDKHNFLLNHEVGETLYIDDEKRAARLVELGLCELVAETDHTLVNEEAESEAIDEVAAAEDETTTDGGRNPCGRGDSGRRGRNRRRRSCSRNGEGSRAEGRSQVQRWQTQSRRSQVYL